MENLFVDFKKFTSEELVLAAQLKNFLMDFEQSAEYNLCELYELAFVVNDLIKSMAELTNPTAKRNAEIIRLRYFTKEKCVSYSELGKMYNLTAESVRHSVYKTFSQIRKNGKSEPLYALVFKIKYIENQILELKKEKMRLERESHLKGKLDFKISDLKISASAIKALRGAGKYSIRSIVRAMKCNEPIKGLVPEDRAEVIRALNTSFGIKIK